MKTTHKTLIAGALGLGMLTMSVIPAFADTASATSTLPKGFLGNFMSALAQRFNLNPTEVQQFFKEQLAQRKQEGEQKEEQKASDRLSKALAAGKLTQAQVDAIRAEQVSVKAQVQALRGKSGKDLKTALQAIRASVQAWAEANNIPPQFVNFVMAGDMGRGFGRGFKFGQFIGKHGDREGREASSTKERDENENHNASSTGERE